MAIKIWIYSSKNHTLKTILLNLLYCLKTHLRNFQYSFSDDIKGKIIFMGCYLLLCLTATVQCALHMHNVECISLKGSEVKVERYR